VQDRLVSSEWLYTTGSPSVASPLSRYHMKFSPREKKKEKYGGNSKPTIKKHMVNHKNINIYEIY